MRPSRTSRFGELPRSDAAAFIPRPIAFPRTWIFCPFMPMTATTHEDGPGPGTFRQGVTGPGMTGTVRKVITTRGLEQAMA